MKLEYPPGATPIDADEAAGLIPSHLTLQRELNEFEEANVLLATEWLFARRRGDPLDERFIREVPGCVNSSETSGHRSSIGPFRWTKSRPDFTIGSLPYTLSRTATAAMPA